MDKREYELSLWRDIPQEDGSYKEEKIAVLSNHEATSPYRAYDVTLTENINGQKTLHFSINRLYRTADNDELERNPLIDRVVNESKVKFRKGAAYNLFNDDGSFNESALGEEDSEEKWIDFIVKVVDDTRSDNTIYYTAYESYVNELGKNGWAVVLDSKLENNYGTLEELASTALAESDWIVAPGYSPTETSKEHTAKVVLQENASAKSVISGSNLSIGAGETIYVRYSDVQYNGTEWEIKDGNIQFIYYPTLDFSQDRDGDKTFIDEELQYAYEASDIIPRDRIHIMGTEGSPIFQANFIVKKPISHYSPQAERYVEEYKTTSAAHGKNGLAAGETVYKYDKTTYLTSSIVKNYTSNFRNFISTMSWRPIPGEKNQQPPELLTIPRYDRIGYRTNTITNYLLLKRDNATRWYSNEGPNLEGLHVEENQTFVVRYKGRLISRYAIDYVNNRDESMVSLSNQDGMSVELGYWSNGTWTVVSNSKPFGLKASQLNTDANDVDTYGYGKSADSINDRKTANNSGTYVDEKGYAYTYLNITEDTNSILNKLELRINVKSGTASNIFDYALAELQFFEYLEDSNGLPIFLEDIPTGEAIVESTFFRVKDSEIEELPSIESYYEPVYADDFNSVRHIEIRESNYYDIIQTLSETFEAWASFHIAHTKDGRILLDSTGKPVKQVRFSRYSPNEGVNFAGFKYGVNLNNISRNTDSNSLVTKLIVKNNNQEFAKDGSASIARANSNPHGENELFDFTYYINQGILDYTQALRDLYGTTSRDLAFYPRLKKLNNEYTAAAEMLGSYRMEVAKSDSAIEALDVLRSSVRQRADLAQNMLNLIPEDDHKRREPYLEELAMLTAYVDNISKEESHHSEVLNKYSELLKADEGQLDVILDNKKVLKKTFYEKYSKYLQEGTWIDESYIDDELYYLDATNIANQSAFPQVTYTIDVADISRVEGFEAYDFNMGELTTIEDTEFFGWEYIDIPTVGTVKTPYKMQVIITETSVNYDDPSDVKILVQNYTSKFDELFQRMSAATNTLEYRQGEFQKANQIINEDGSLNIKSIEQAFAENVFSLANANNQSFELDNAGLEMTDDGNSSLITRMIAGGLFISSDGGRTWSAGVTGNGINTAMLTAGVVNTEEINLITGEDLRFTWTGDGITALDRGVDGGYNFNKFVRFNDYGLYGTTAGSSLENALLAAQDFNEEVKAIQEYSNWSLTWDGLVMRHVDGGFAIHPTGGLSIFNPHWTWTQEQISYPPNKAIDPTDITMYEVGEEIPLISLGRQYDNLSDTPYYGLRMRNKDGNITMVTNNSGDLWVKDTLELGTKELTQATIAQTDEITGERTELSENYFKYIYFNGNPNEELTYLETPMIAIGDIDQPAAPFKVYGDGYLVAMNALIKGTFIADSMALSGNIEIGDFAGVNGFPDENGRFDYTFWSGKKDGHPTWYVTPDGLMVAEDAYIYGHGTFQGDVYADNGYFNGEINATSGHLKGLISFGNKSVDENGNEIITSYIGASDNPYYINIEDNFRVNTKGDIFGDTLSLSKNTFWGNKEQDFYNILIGHNGNPLTVYDPTSTNEQEKVVFGINQDGSINMDGTLRTANDIVFDGVIKDASGTLIIDGKRASIEAKTPAVDGWGIYGNGDAYFNNVIARGKISTAVFEYDKISSVGGKLLVSPSVMLEEPIEGTPTNDGYAFELADLPGINETWSHVNKILIEYNGIDLDGVGFDYSTKSITLTTEELSGLRLESINTLPKGLIIISTSSHVNSLLLDSTDPMGGYLKIAGPDASTLPGVNSTVVLGNLQNRLIPTKMREQYFGNDLGYGLYADNAYITGKVYLPNAGITNEDTLYNGSPIRIFAGASPLEKEKSTFIVTQDGTMYSEQAVIRGTIEAVDSVFSGHIIGSGVLLDKDHGFENETLDHFYFSRHWGVDEPSPRTYVLDITEEATNIWRDFNIYSSADNADILYAYSEDRVNPWPLFSKHDKSVNQFFHPHFSATGLHVWDGFYADEYTSSVKIEKGYVSFSQTMLDNKLSQDYSGAEDLAWSKTPDMVVGLVGTRQGEVHGIQSSTGVYFTDGENIAIEVAPRTDTAANRENISRTTVRGSFVIDDTIEVRKDGESVVFNYIG